jgi:penicillin-binding protein 2
MFLRRVRMLFVLLCLPFAAVAARLGQLQLGGTSAVGGPSRPSSVVRSYSDAPRGRILDTRGRELARDRVGFDLCVDYFLIHPGGDRLKREVRKRVPADRRKDPKAAEEARAAVLAEVEAFWDRLASLTGRSREQLEAARSAVARDIERRRESVRKARNLSAASDVELAEEREEHVIVAAAPREVAMAVEGADPRPAGVSTRPARTREYPLGDRACHILGTVGPASAKELESPLSEDRLDGFRPGDVAGRGGVEQSADARLRGKRGVTVRAAGRGDGPPLRQADPSPGEDVRLTLDIDLQAGVEDALNRKGAVVVLDVATGGVLAMASFPRYDLNAFREIYAELRDDTENRPLVNRAVSAYAPGSTVKPVVGIAALEAGAVSEHTCLACTGRWPEGGGFACWIHSKGGGSHGPVRLTTALAQSCNHYFFHAAQMTGGQAVAEWFRRFGLGRPTGVGLPGEAGGFVPDEDWLVRKTGHGWTHADERLASIGQGAMLATPLQMADVAATLARSGIRRPPTLFADEAAVRRGERVGASRASLSVVARGMREVVEEPSGLAFKTVKIAGLPIAGKTGSAQVWTAPSPDGQRAKAAPHCWFIGYAPADSPRIAVAVLLENVPDGSGGGSAGPYAKRVVELARDLGHLDGAEGVTRVRGQLASPRR